MLCRAIADNVKTAAEPYLVPMLPYMLERLCDKVSAVKAAAEGAADALVTRLNPHCAPLVIQVGGWMCQWVGMLVGWWAGDTNQAPNINILLPNKPAHAAISGPSNQ